MGTKSASQKEREEKNVISVKSTDRRLAALELKLERMDKLLEETIAKLNTK